MKYYHLLSDEKTVKEITQEKYRRISNRCKTAVVAKSWLNIRKGNHYVYIDLRQLQQMLER